MKIVDTIQDKVTEPECDGVTYKCGVCLARETVCVVCGWCGDEQTTDGVCSRCSAPTPEEIARREITAQHEHHYA